MRTCLLGTLAASLFCLSCAEQSDPAAGVDPWTAAKVARPVKGLPDAFRLVAREEGLPTDDLTVFNLAADSRICTKWDSPATGRLFVVMPRYRGTDRIDALRGAQVNGSFYVFRVTPSRPMLVGRFEGNSCHIEKKGKVIEATATFHLSATEWGERTYVWDASKFVRTSHTMRQGPVEPGPGQ